MKDYGIQFDGVLGGLGWGELLRDRMDGQQSRGILREIFAEQDARHSHGTDLGGSAQIVLPPTSADLLATTATTASIAPGDILVSKLDSVGDHDWVKITLTAGQHVTLLLSGIGASGLEDPLLTLRNSTGGVVLRNDDIDPGVVRDSRIEFTATTSGVYYLDVGAYDNGYAGDYQLQVFDSTSSSDTIQASAATSASMVFGGEFNGVLETSTDRDWVAIEVKAGQTYVVRVAGDGTSALVNPNLTMRSANGTIIGQNENTYGNNPEVTFTAQTSGTYFIDVGGTGAGATGEYKITVTKPLEVYTYDQIASQLTEGYWGDGRHSFVVGTDNELSVNLSALGANEKTLAKAALRVWTDVIGVTFVETTGTAEITFQNNEEGAFSDSTYDAAGRILSSVVNVSVAWVQDYGTSLNSYSMQTFIHEIGHALGLGHGGDYNGSANYPLDASYANDCWSTTVMSYFAPSENTYFSSRNFSTDYLTTPMNADVVAMTDLYGLSTTTRTGNTVYGFNTNAGNVIFNAAVHSSTAYCIVDSGGIDTLNYSGFAANQAIDLHQEVFMNIGTEIGNVIIGRGTVIENANGGSGADLITGNDVANILNGNAGADVISGNGGSDKLLGGAGNDRLMGGVEDDRLFGGDGADFLDAGAGADMLSGDLGNDRLNGAAGNDTILGCDGDDFLNGGDGADILRGGAGNDILIGGRGLDVLTGGLGADQFRFDNQPVAANVATITDFAHLVDTIAFNRAVFTGLTANGALDAAAFRLGTSARDSDDRIIYSRATGEVFYDVDGVGGLDQLLVAKVTAGKYLSVADFTVFGVAAADPIKPIASEPLGVDASPAISSNDLSGLL